jgi:hypothetical protein
VSLFLAIWGLIHLSSVQQYIVRYATTTLSKNLKTEINIKSVDISPFNKFILEGVLVRDKQKDTLLYAAAAKLRITDWFFLKDNITFHYIGLDKGFIHLKRVDSVWNTQFILDALSSPKKTTSNSNIKLALEKLEITQFRFIKEDGWRGEDMNLSLAKLDLSAKDIDLKKKTININAIEIKAPTFGIKQYDGKRPAALIPKDDIYARWNPDQWDIKVEQLNLANGTFSSDMQSSRPMYSHFDEQHILFKKIDGEIKNIRLQQDTMSAQIQLKTEERSGFKINSLRALMKMHPRAMTFNELEILTPYSRIGNSFTMHYTSFNDDMLYFITRIKLDGRFSNSHVNFKDIAFFAPEVKTLDLELDLDGHATGTISNLKSSDLQIKYGKNTVLTGNFSMTGLPDPQELRYKLENTQINTSPEDVFTFYPNLRKIKNIHLEALGNSTFQGEINGNIKDLTVQGNLASASGMINTKLNLYDIASKNIKIDLAGELVKFNASKLLDINQLGAASGKFTLSSKQSQDINVESNITSLFFNNYLYSNISVSGKYKNKSIESRLSIRDNNIEAGLALKINLGEEMPKTTLDAQILSSNLKNLTLTTLPLKFAGRARAEIVGNTLENIMGNLKFYDLIIFKNDQGYVMDSLMAYTQIRNNYRTFNLHGSDIEVNMQGNFEFAQLGPTFSQYFSQFYPLYFNQNTSLTKDQDISFDITLKNTSAFLKILNNGISGFNNSTLSGSINTKNRLFSIDAQVPKFTYKKIAVYDYTIKGQGNYDSLMIKSKASSLVFNDSLSFPNNEITIHASHEQSLVDINTFSEQSEYGAKLSASVSNLDEGVLIHFNPSSLVFNEKTWHIEKDGEILISKSKLNATNFKISNGEQVISVLAFPPEANTPQNIILALTKVNLGDLLPFVLKEPRIQGITTGDLTIEDPFDKLKLYLNAQTDKTRFEDDSIGITTINAFWDNTEKRASYFVESNNPDYLFGIKGKLNLADSTKNEIDTDLDIKNVQLSILERYLGVVFSNMEGVCNGKLRIHGKLEEPDLTGEVKVNNGKLTIAYSQCTYQLLDPVIVFKPDMINFGTIELKDIYGNQALLKGTLEHHFFKNFKYNITANSKKILVLNTRKENNNLFHGKAIAKFNFSFLGPEDNMQMNISGTPVDTSTINILTSGGSKQTADVDYIVWKTIGQEMKSDKRLNNENLTIDLDLTASPLLRMNVVLDELTGDIISGIGNGNLKIHTGTTEKLSILGRYNIESGNYNFNFQDIFKKPFKLVGDGNSYISWTGDPYNADINIDATYLAEKVRMSTLFTDPSNSTISGVSSDVLREISDVEVRCKLTGTLNRPNPTFQIVIPQGSSVRNNTTIDSKIKTINRDALEVSKQATYLIVFKSFAPQAAVVASDLNSELINTTISGVINGILSSSIQNFFSKVLGAAVDVNLNYSRTLMTADGTNTGNSGNPNNFRENVSLQFIKSLVNDKLIISFGSDFNFSSVGGSTFAGNTQSFLFLPDVNVEYKITPDGKFRTSFFYRSNFDLLSTSGKRDRTGGNVSFRTEFDRLFERKKKITPLLTETNN